MRLITIKTIVILLITRAAWAQTPFNTTGIIKEKIISDTINNSPNKEFERRINLKPIHLSDSDFEVRFYTLNIATNSSSLRLVKFSKGSWEALEFVDKNKSRDVQKYTLITTSGYEKFLTGLIEQNFTTLPDQREVDQKIENSFPSKKEALQATPSIMDGDELTVEFKNGNKFRVYQFRNPASYLKYYPTIEEFKNYASIQKIFEHDLVRK